MTQRNGRIIRQSNRNKEVQVYQYVTEGTFDAYLYQTLENKQKFISQIMTSKSPVRSCDDVDEQALSYKNRTEKTTEIYFDEKAPTIFIRTHNTDLKNRLTAYSRQHPAVCKLTDVD